MLCKGAVKPFKTGMRYLVLQHHICTLWQYSVMLSSRTCGSALLKLWKSVDVSVTYSILILNKCVLQDHQASITECIQEFLLMLQAKWELNIWKWQVLGIEIWNRCSILEAKIVQNLISETVKGWGMTEQFVIRDFLISF